MRMIAITFISVVDSTKIQLVKKTRNTDDSQWVELSNVPKKLAYDHSEILDYSLKTLRQQIFDTAILKNLFPNGFTLPELQKVCEVILEQPIDRRNFRKQILANKSVKLTSKTRIFDGKKPAKVYKFKT